MLNMVYRSRSWRLHEVATDRRRSDDKFMFRYDVPHPSVQRCGWRLIPPSGFSLHLLVCSFIHAFWKLQEQSTGLSPGIGPCKQRWSGVSLLKSIEYEIQTNARLTIFYMRRISLQLSLVCNVPQEANFVSIMSCMPFASIPIH